MSFGSYVSRAYVPSGINPATAFGCLLYVDADTGVTLDGSSRAINVVDQSGNGNTLDSTITGPTVGSFRNGRLAFNPDGDIKRTTLTGGNRAQPYTIMFCGTWPDSLDGNGCIAVYPFNGSGNVTAAYQNFNFGPFRVRMDGPTSQVLFDVASNASGINKPPQGSAFALTNVFDGASSTVRIWINGHAKKTATVAGDIGAGPASAFFLTPSSFKKQLAAAALYAGAMSVSDQETLLETICARYSIVPVSPIDPLTVPGLLVDISGAAGGNTTSAGRYTAMVNAGSYGQTFAENSSNGPTVDSTSFNGVNSPFFSSGKYLYWPHVSPTSYPFGNMHNLSEAYLCFRITQNSINASYGLYLSTMVGTVGTIGFHLKCSPSGQLLLDTGNGTVINAGASAAGVIQPNQQHFLEVVKRIVGGTQVALDGYVDGVQVITGTPFTPSASAQTSATYFGNYVGGTTLHCNAAIGRALNYDNIPSADTRAGIRAYLEAQYP